MEYMFSELNAHGVLRLYVKENNEWFSIVLANCW